MPEGQVALERAGSPQVLPGAKIGMAAARLCLLAIVALVPLIILPWLSDPLQLPKLQALQVLETVCLLALLAGLGPVELWRRWRASPIFWPAVLYLIWVGLSTATSVDLATSIWGATDRWGGASTLFAYVLLPFLAIATLRTPRDLLVAAMAALGAACIVSLYGLAQYGGWDFVAWNVDWVQSAFSTMGNPDFLANYELLYIFLAAGLYAMGWPRRGRWLLLLSSGLCAGAMWATQTRSAWLVFVIAAVILVLWLRSDRAVAVRLRRLVLVWVLAMVVVLAYQPSIRARVISIAVDAVRAAGYALHIPMPSVTTETGNSMAQRIWIWRGVVHMIAARPWTGWGPDTMYENFARYQAPDKAKVFPPNIIIDRAHNDYLQVAVDSGLPALAAYVWLLIAALKRGVEAWRRTTAPPVRALLLATMAGGIAYWIEIGVNIAMPASAPHAWFWIGGLLVAAELGLRGGWAADGGDAGSAPADAGAQGEALAGAPGAV